MNFELPPLPWPMEALEPVVSRNTIDFHYNKHHQSYMTKLKQAVEGTPAAEKSLEEIVKTSGGMVFNNSAQVWNHTFFWHSMKPNGGGEPPAGPLLDMLKRDFGDWATFRTKFIEAGMGRFGSGWAWLVLENGHLKITSTANADTPLTSTAKPLLTADVWEHAYYLDYQNRRDNFLTAFCDKLLNWDFVAQNLR